MNDFDGAEADVIIVHFEKFDSPFYTAMARAKRLLIMVTDDKTDEKIMSFLRKAHGKNLITSY